MSRKVSQNSSKTGDLRAPNRRQPSTATRQAYIAKYAASAPKTYRRAYLRAAAGRSRIAAIKIFCLECVGWLRREVTECSAVDCPLWPYRPFQRATAQARKRALWCQQVSNEEESP